MTHGKSLLVFLVCLISVSCSRRQEVNVLADSMLSVANRSVDPRPLVGFFKENQDLFNEPLVREATRIADERNPAGLVTVAGYLSNVYYEWQDYPHAIYFARLGLKQGDDIMSIDVLARCAAEMQDPSLIQDFSVRQQQIVGKSYPILKMMAERKPEEAIKLLSPMVFTDTVKAGEVFDLGNHAKWLARAARQTKNCEEGLTYSEKVWTVFFGTAGAQAFIQKNMKTNLKNRSSVISSWVWEAIDVSLSAYTLSKQCHDEKWIQLWRQRGKMLVNALCTYDSYYKQYSVLLLPKFEQ